MPDTPSITINKLMQYRGKDEEYSNTYHFSGTTPTNDAGWKDLADAIWNQEKTFLRADHKYLGYYGYEAGNEHAVSLFDIRDGGGTPPGGTFTDGSATVAPGDSAMWVRWLTPERTSRGKKIYLRKYFHGVLYNPNTELISGPQRTAMVAYAEKMKDGTLPGSAKICGPQGAPAGEINLSVYPTTRTLKRRGKRPSS